MGDIGERVRRRFCTNPPPALGELNCEGIVAVCLLFEIISCLFTFLELGLGPDREEVACEGTIPKQSDDPNEFCYTIFG